MMSDLRRRQSQFNAESRDQWEGFADHRAKVSALLAAGPDLYRSRLCVLGAGNSNDLNLPALLLAHREVHLVDLDPQALDRGLTGQGVATHPGLYRHGGIDVTAMLDAVARWSPMATVTDLDLSALVDWPSRRVSLTLPGPFDLVASTCLLSQIVGNAFVTVGEHHPRFQKVVQGIRLGHLRLLVHLTRPGGRVVLINDVVSSEQLAELSSIDHQSLPGLLERLAEGRGGTTHGMNPGELLALFRHDPMLSARVAELIPTAPWRWKLHNRHYLVWALTVRLVA